MNASADRMHSPGDASDLFQVRAAPLRRDQPSSSPTLDYGPPQKVTQNPIVAANAYLFHKAKNTQIVIVLAGMR